MLWESTFQYLAKLVINTWCTVNWYNWVFIAVLKFEKLPSDFESSGKRVPLQVLECSVEGTRCKAGGHVFAAGCDCTPPDRPTPCPSLPTFYPRDLTCFDVRCPPATMQNLCPLTAAMGRWEFFNLCLFAIGVQLGFVFVSYHFGFDLLDALFFSQQLVNLYTA